MAYLPGLQNSQTRTINGTGYQVSITQPSLVSYCIQIASTLSLSGGQTGTVFLEISPDNITYTEVGRFVNGNTGTLTIGLNTTDTKSSQLSAYVPKSYYVRLRQTSSGTPTITYISGQETLF